MINPLRSEAEAYRFLLLTVGYFAAIALAALVIGTWAGVIVFLLLTVPRLARWAAARRMLAIATLVGVLGTLWLPTEWPWANVPLLRDVLRRWNDVATAGEEALPLGALAQVLAFAGLSLLVAAAIHANWVQEPEFAESPVQLDDPSPATATSR